MKILCADDSAVSRNLVEATLKKWGYDVVVASDGHEAWEILKHDSGINIAILDWVMPGLTGPEVCRRLREHEHLDHGRYVYTILLTSKSLREDMIEGFESGADDYITKPFDQHELKVRLRAGTRILDRLGYSEGPLQPIQFYSCFISYSSRDEELVSKLHGDLVRWGITCWYAPVDLRIGDKFRTAIDESIKLHDKLLVVLSESSIDSKWVESEVGEAEDEEERRKQTGTDQLRGNVTVLFPIRIDDAVFNTSAGWAASLRRTRHIGDFRSWREPKQYRLALERLLRDLEDSKQRDQAAVANRKRLAEKQAPTSTV